MDAEKLIKKIKNFLESSDDFNNCEIHILPCKGDPTFYKMKHH